MRWADLPTELIEMIATPLSVRDWCTMGRVCRDWRTATRSEAQLVSRGWTPKNFVKTHHMVCGVCGMRRAKMRATIGGRECTQCRDADALVTQGRAMGEFGISKAHLRQVPHIRLLNPYGGSGDMRLFRASAIRMFLKRCDSDSVKLLDNGRALER